jgi:hypothetical protein
MGKDAFLNSDRYAFFDKNFILYKSRLNNWGGFAIHPAFTILISSKL